MKEIKGIIEITDFLEKNNFMLDRYEGQILFVKLNVVIDLLVTDTIIEDFFSIEEIEEEFKVKFL